MTENQVVNQAQTAEVKNDTEYNFRALEAKHRREMEQERSARIEIERQIKELSSRQKADEEESDNEPYVNDKKLDRKLSDFEKRMEERIEKRSEEKAYNMLQEDKQQSWLKQNSDFYDVMQHAEKFAQHDPELAETILKMPEGFERQKLVYKSIKALGIHKPPAPMPSIQDKIDANRRSPYYMPSGPGAAPYSSQGDFSPAGQKAAHAKMQELKNRLRG
jgi:hypothetical protein